ncbi:trafficking protein particle complex subunit [Anaeramoeba flamelloides]|uniref:Trafficking protein particle complex subunit n=1 Tax=Anaeramoeba flamelloides TaxID=1746091 RepID=A0AAV8A9E6_9EUKA|nr:trafficking protein particle complex subunit [Anaeramoeba flamelloides]
MMNFSRCTSIFDPYQRITEPSFLKISVVPVGSISINSFEHFYNKLKQIQHISHNQLLLKKCTSFEEKCLEFLFCNILKYIDIHSHSEKEKKRKEKKRNEKKRKENKKKLHSLFFCFFFLFTFYFVQPTSNNPNIKQGWERGFIKIQYSKDKTIKNEWEEFQPHKKIWAIVGIANSTIDNEQKKIRKDLTNLIPSNKKKKKKHKRDGNKKGEIYQPIVRCLKIQNKEDGFQNKENKEEENKEQKETKNKKEQKPSIFIPITDDDQKIEQAIKQIVSDVVENLAQIIATPLNNWKPLKVPLKQKFSNEEQKNSNKSQAQYYKWVADHCLLTGLLEDARTHYNKVITTTSSSSDSIWNASSKESIVCLNILQNKYRSKEKLNQNVIDSYREILLIYKKKKIEILKIEAALKFSRFLLETKQIGNRKIGIEILYDLYSHSPNLEIDEMILLYLNLASLYEIIGFKRKVNFFLAQIAYLFKEKGNWKMLHDFLLYSCPILNEIHIQQNPPTTSQSTSTPISTSLEFSLSSEKLSSLKMETLLVKSTNTAEFSNKIKNTKKWINIQIPILFELITASSHLEDYLKLIHYMIYLLQNHRSFLSKSFQKKMIILIQQASNYLPLTTRVNINGFPTILEYNLITKNEEIKLNKIITKENKNQQNKADVFIFSPFANKNKQKSKSEIEVLEYTENEKINLSIILSNPFEFEINIQKIYFNTNSKQFHSFPISLTIPPLTKEFNCILTGKSLLIGDVFKICECIIEIYNLQFIHPIKINKKIKIIKSKPLLKITRIGNSNLNLFEGEYFNTSLLFENIGSKPINKIEISYQIKYDKEQQITENSIYQDFYLPPILSFDEKLIKSNCPLKFNQNFILPLKWCARKNLKKIDILIKYFNQPKPLSNLQKKIENNNDHGDDGDVNHKIGSVNNIEVTVKNENEGDENKNEDENEDENENKNKNEDENDDENENDQQNEDKDDHENEMEDVNYFRISKIPYYLNITSGLSLMNFSLIKPNSTFLKDNYNFKNELQSFISVLELKNFTNMKFHLKIKIMKKSENYNEKSSKLIKNKYNGYNKDGNDCDDQENGYNFSEINKINKNSKNIQQLSNKSLKKQKKIDFQMNNQIFQHCEKRLIFPIQNLLIPKQYSSKIPLEETIENFIQTIHSIPSEEQEKKLSQLVSLKSMLIERINLSWESENNRRGGIFLHNLVIKRENFDILTQKTVGVNLITQENYNINQLQPIEFVINNNRKQEIKVQFNIEIFEKEKILNYLPNSSNSINSKLRKNRKNIEKFFQKDPYISKNLFWMGQTIRKNITINTNDSFSHKLYVSFFEPGEFTLRFNCSSLKKRKYFFISDTKTIKVK